MPRASILPASLPPRMIGREAAAEYVGVSATKFDQLVGDGRMPRPRCIDRRRAWDRLELDVSCSALPIDGEDAPADTTWDD